MTTTSVTREDPARDLDLSKPAELAAELRRLALKAIELNDCNMEQGELMEALILAKYLPDSGAIEQAIHIHRVLGATVRRELKSIGLIEETYVDLINGLHTYLQMQGWECYRTGRWQVERSGPCG